jgi:hypothetical protein
MVRDINFNSTIKENKKMKLIRELKKEINTRGPSAKIWN